MATIDAFDRKIRILSPLDLADLIERHNSQIVARFVVVSRATVPAASEAPTSYLIDHLPEVLNGYVAFLRQHGRSIEWTKIAELSSSHGAERTWLGTYTFSEIRKEYSIVRNAIIDLLGSECFLDADAMCLFMEIHESALCECIARFTNLTS